MQILTKIFNDTILVRVSLTCDNRCLAEISSEFYLFFKENDIFTNMSFAHNLKSNSFSSLR